LLLLLLLVGLVLLLLLLLLLLLVVLLLVLLMLLLLVRLLLLLLLLLLVVVPIGSLQGMVLLILLRRVGLLSRIPGEIDRGIPTRSLGYSLSSVGAGWPSHIGIVAVLPRRDVMDHVGAPLSSNRCIESRTTFVWASCTFCIRLLLSVRVALCHEPGER